MASSASGRGGPSWSQLPSDDLRLIFSKLPLRKLRSVRMVCRSWNAAARGLSDFSTKDISRRDGVVLRSLPAAFGHLTSLSLELAKTIDDNGLEPLAQLTTLRHLDLSHRDLVTDRGLSYVCRIPYLVSLKLVGCHRLTDAGLQEISTSLTRLTLLHLGAIPRLSSAGIASLASLTALEDLKLFGCARLTDEGLQHLHSLDQLRRLDLRGCLSLRMSPEEIQALFPHTPTILMPRDLNIPS